MAKKRYTSLSPASKNSRPVLVLDAGTTAVKALVFEGDAILAEAEAPLRKKVRRRGGATLVEQDPREMVATSVRVLRRVLRDCGLRAAGLAGLGLTNQRETVVFWDRRGRPLYPAIVWEDNRGAADARRLRRASGAAIRAKTGLPPDAYFSAFKMKWLLEHVPGARRRAAAGEICAGTVDSWLLWNLCAGHPHLTDYTNAARTLLFNIRTLCWDKDLLSIFGVPAKILPAVRPSSGEFGRTARSVLGGEVPVLAVCGDQQASMFAAGARRGAAKITYGTGAFVAEFLGGRPMLRPEFYTTLTPGAGRRPAYMLEAKVENCGARIAPLIGREKKMRRAVTQLVRATDAYIRRLPIRPRRLIVDGGVTRYGPLVSIQEKISKIPAARQKVYDGTALGAARLVYKYLRHG